MQAKRCSLRCCRKGAVEKMLSERRSLLHAIGKMQLADASLDAVGKASLERCSQKDAIGKASSLDAIGKVLLERCYRKCAVGKMLPTRRFSRCCMLYEKDVAFRCCRRDVLDAVEEMLL